MYLISLVVILWCFVHTCSLPQLSNTIVRSTRTFSIDRIDRILRIAGGSTDEEELVDDGKEDGEDIEDSDLISEDLDNPDDASVPSPLMQSLQDLYIKTPPMTRIYVSSTLLATLACFIFNKNVWPDALYLEWDKVFLKLQLWRPFTAFLYFGPFGLNYLLTLQFVWTYMSQLERLQHRAPEEYLVMCVFGCAALALLYAALGLSNRFLGHNLSTFLVYIWARLFEGTEVR